MTSTTVKPWLFAALVSTALPVLAQPATGDTPIGEPTNPLLWLALVTLLAVGGLVVLQMFRLRRAKQQREHSALSRGDVKTDPQSR